ncbi:MAG: hypothetical protein ACPGD8_09235, partial [Flavobacteriales bacterium]
MINRIQIWLGNKSLFLGVLAAVLSFCYVVTRAVYVPPFCDEVTTYFDFIISSNFLPPTAKLDANNHLLNSFLTRVSIFIFGDSALSLRLPNILAYLVFLGYGFRFKKHFQNKDLWLAWMVAFLSSLYFITFFQLARGYGLSMAFFLASIYHLINLKQNVSWVNITATAGFAILAVTANLSLIFPIALIGLMLTIRIITSDGANGKKTSQIVALGLGFGTVLLLLTWHLLELKNGGKLYYGGTIGFWKDSIERSAVLMLDSESLGQGLSYLLALGILLLPVIHFKKNRKRALKTIQFLLLGSVGLTLSAHFILDVKFPVDRAALHFLLLGLSLWFLEIDRADSSLLRAFGWLPTFIFLITGCYQANTSYSLLWKTVAVPTEFYEHIRNWQNENTTPTISAHGLNLTNLTYLNRKHKDWLLESNPNWPNKTSDFILTDESLKDQSFPNYDTIFYSKHTSLALLQRRAPINWR